MAASGLPEGFAPVMVQHLGGIVAGLSSRALRFSYVPETGKVVHEKAAELAEDPQSLVRFLGVH